MQGEMWNCWFLLKFSRKRKKLGLKKTGAQFKKAIKLQGGGNDCVVVANGHHIPYTINGERMTDNSPKGRKMASSLARGDGKCQRGMVSFEVLT